MLLSPPLLNLIHGSVGILDEVLVYCLPVVVIVIILTISSRRARKQEHQRPRERKRESKE
jgi:cytochrome c-type biogenesis protein CcmH/NrfF